MVQLDQEQKDLIKANLDKYFKSNNYDGFFKDVVRGQKYPYAHFFTDVVGRDMLSFMRDIPNELYKDDPDLRYIKIPANIKTVGEDAFSNCKQLKQVIVEDGVVSFGVRCFNGCESLESIKLPNTLKDIPKGCFRNCTSLKRIDIPGSVTAFGAGDFAGCSDDLLITYPYKENANERPSCSSQDVEFMKKHLRWRRPKVEQPVAKEE